MEIITEKKRPGAPQKALADRGIDVGLRLTPARKVKFKLLGGAHWLSRVIDKAVVK